MAAAGAAVFVWLGMVPAISFLGVVKVVAPVVAGVLLSR